MPPPDQTTVTHASGLGTGWPLVAGRCPACGHGSLALADGHVTCLGVGCRAPEAADDVLHEGPWQVYPLRRREWAAAYRSVAEGLATEGYGELHGMITGFADAIEDGVLTPWADQPESADDCGEDCTRHATCRPPAEPSAAAPAAEREHVVANAVAFEVYGADGRPSSPAGDTLAIRVTDEERATAYHAARRVLAHLAEFDAEHDGDSPAAAGPHPDTPDRAGVLGRALLHQTVDGHPQLWAERDGLWHTHIASGPRTRVYIESAERYVGPVLLVSPAAGRVLDAAREWRAASTAYRLGHTDQVARIDAALDDLVAAVDALDGEDDNPDQAGALERAGIDPDELDALDGDQPAEPATPPARVECACGVPIVHATADGYGRDGCDDPDPNGQIERLNQTVADAEQRADAAEDRMVTASAERQWAIDGVCRRCGHGLPAEAALEPDSGPGFDRQVIEMMIEQLSAGLSTEQVQADQLRALLADRDRLADAVERHEATIDGTNEWAAEARADLAEMTASRDRWRHRAETAESDWGTLARRCTALEAELATARRDAAADALQYAADDAYLCLQVKLGDRLRQVEAEIRAGTRPVPGSPQPADGGGDDA